jgi:hypothetical protein
MPIIEIPINCKFIIQTMSLFFIYFSSELATMANSVTVLTFALVLVACASALNKCQTTPHIAQPPVSWKKGNVILVALLKGG